MTLPEVEGGWRCILADPPWRFETWGASGRAPPYGTMTLAELKRLPVTAVAAPDAVLFLWITWPMLPQALEVIEAWGFTYKTCAFAWLKLDPYRLFALEEDVAMGLGYWTRANSEVCLLATRGSPKRLDAGVRQGVVAAPREHSRKPSEIHKRIERLVAGPRLELFARESRSGWIAWGNEVTKFD